MHNSIRYSNIILLLLITMIIMKIGSSFIKNINRKHQYYHTISKALYNGNNVYNRNYHTTRIMMTATDSSIEALSNNIQIAG
jgi:hypothetical protein